MVDVSAKVFERFQFALLAAGCWAAAAPAAVRSAPRARRPADEKGRRAVGMQDSVDAENGRRENRTGAKNTAGDRQRRERGGGNRTELDPLSGQGFVQ